MKKRLLAALALPACVVILASCETTVTSAPPVTAAFVRAGNHDYAEAQTLEAGRKVFLNRCIPCHALPDIARYDSGRIPGIVRWMSGRARLTPEQTAALTKYLVTVKAQL
jgi:mono/diheme cytochrome c family protein